MDVRLRDCLATVPIIARRLRLDTGRTRATAPMLRGVWGAALRELDPAAYRCVFEGVRGDGSPTPGYVVRPAAPDPAIAPAVEFVLIGAATAHVETTLRAWDVASGMGLGRARERFIVRGIQPLGPDGRPGGREPWGLDAGAWPLDGNPGHTPCRLDFPAPLRILRDGRLVAAPGLADVVASALRRLAAFLDLEHQATLAGLRERTVEAARACPARAWDGRPLDLVRYSGSQKREIELRGVSGAIDLQAGPGALWPLLAAAQWLHVGKGTVFGLGQLVIRPLETG